VYFIFFVIDATPCTRVFTLTLMLSLCFFASDLAPRGSEFVSSVCLHVSCKYVLNCYRICIRFRRKLATCAELELEWLCRSFRAEFCVSMSVAVSLIVWLFFCWICRLCVSRRCMGVILGGRGHRFEWHVDPHAF